jgi:hypothetical protein
VNVLAAVLVLAAIASAAALCWPAAQRTGLRVWHPTLAWLALHALFFGLGSARLALDGRSGPGLYVAAAALLFGAAVALSDRLARRRAGGGPEVDGREAERPVDEAPLRPLAVVGLAALGLLLVLPTLVRVGLPFLVEDITGARSELAGPELQLLRVAVPALALAIVLGSRGRLVSWLVVAALITLEIALASRYLAAELLAVLFLGIGLAGWRVRPRLVLAGALIAIVGFGGIQVLRAYDQAAGRELAFAMERTVNRVVLVQPRTLEALQAAIPAEQPYFGGLTWLRRLGPALGRPDIPNLGYWVYPRIFPGQTPPGYAAPGLIGEAWANFGPLGLALFALLGVTAERLGAFLSRRRYATGDLIAGTLAVVFLARTHALGLNGLAFLLVLVVVWRIVAAGGLAGTRSALRDVLRWHA